MLAGRPLPEEERYDGYIQLENGVGMIRLMTSEVEEALKTADDDGKEEELSMATGVLAYPYIKEYLETVSYTHLDVYKRQALALTLSLWVCMTAMSRRAVYMRRRDL